jgi:hypothetical protein
VWPHWQRVAAFFLGFRAVCAEALNFGGEMRIQPNECRLFLGIL